MVANKEKKEIYSASYKLNATTNPCDITMTSRVESIRGGGRSGLDSERGKYGSAHLRFAGRRDSRAGFKTKEKQLMFVMKKTD